MTIAEHLRPISEEEICILESAGNVSSSWANVLVSGGSRLTSASGQCIRDCQFNGIVVLGDTFASGGELVDIRNGAKVRSGLYRSNFCGNVLLGRGGVIMDVSVLCNVVTSDSAVIMSCGSIVCEGDIPFADGISLNVGPENGGRNIKVRMGDKYSQICTMALSPQTLKHSRSTSELGTAGSGTALTMDMVIVGSGAILSHCPLVRNCTVGDAALVRASSLSDTWVNSSASQPTQVRHSFLRGTLVDVAARVGPGCLVEDSYLMESSSVEDNAKVVSTILAPDASVACGECHHSILGPMVGFNHQSLLIATLWPLGRGNLAYGSKV
jgi:hypothetical protein